MIKLKVDNIIVLVMLSVFFLGAQTVTVESLWEKGQQAVEKGQYQNALEIWETAKYEYENSPGLDANPRIGFDYIKLATQQKMKGYYRNAVEMYKWGVSKGCNINYKKVFSKELERIKPIISKEEHSKWKKVLDSNIKTFCKNLLSFWKINDPTLSDNYNERLLEHWERIAYAKKNFRRSKTTVYDTDDRGTIYVRLGEPDTKKNGTLQFNNGLVRTWIQDIVDSQSQSGISMGSFGGDSAGSSNNLSAQIQNETLKIRELTRQALLTHRYPFYEIWVYRELNESDYNNLVYIFGQDGDTGTFGLRNSLDEMIPSSAFRRSTSNKGLITPGLLLQLLFYEQTSQIDTYFEEAFHNLESRIVSRNGLNRRTSFIVEDQNRSELAFKQYIAPTHKTSLTDKISNIPIEAFQYRFLDKNNKPITANFVLSHPQEAVYLDQVKEKEYNSSNYNLTHKMVTIFNNEIIDEQSQNNKIHYGNMGSVKEMKQSRAYFETPNTPEEMEQLFRVELQNSTKDSTKVNEKGFLDHVSAIGEARSIQPKPLSTNYDELELSDILIGIDSQGVGLASRGPTNFMVIHDHTIPVNTNLMVHFQVYHLDPQESNPNKFSVEYKVSRKENNFFKRIFSNKNQVGLTLNFETLETYSKHNLEIDTTPFEPGEYELQLKITEPTTNREIQKKVSFKIIKE